MKKLWIVLAATGLIAANAAAQEYKFVKTSGRLNINLPVAIIEGTSGNEVVISAATTDNDQDERSKGLRVLSADGLQDNTGLGINVDDKGKETDINQIDNKLNQRKVNIKVPKGITISLAYDKISNSMNSFVLPPDLGNKINWSVQKALHSAQIAIASTHGNLEKLKMLPKPGESDSTLENLEIITEPNDSDSTQAMDFGNTGFNNPSEIVFRNLDNPLEVSAQYSTLKLENVTGPVTIKTVYGNVEASFEGHIKSPVSIVSVYGFVDTTIPVNTKANVDLSTSMGGILVDPEFKFELEKKAPDSEKIHNFWGNDQFKGKLNGGGPDIISLKSTYGKIYVRKK
jgi:hypothetical protein